MICMSVTEARNLQNVEEPVSIHGWDINDYTMVYN